MTLEQHPKKRQGTFGYDHKNLLLDMKNYDVEIFEILHIDQNSSFLHSIIYKLDSFIHVYSKFDEDTSDS